MKKSIKIIIGILILGLIIGITTTSIIFTKKTTGISKSSSNNSVVSTSNSSTSSVISSPSPSPPPSPSYPTTAQCTSSNGVLTCMTGIPAGCMVDQNGNVTCTSPPGSTPTIIPSFSGPTCEPVYSSSANNTTTTNFSCPNGVAAGAVILPDGYVGYPLPSNYNCTISNGVYTCLNGIPPGGIISDQNGVVISQNPVSQLGPVPTTGSSFSCSSIGPGFQCSNGLPANYTLLSTTGVGQPITTTPTSSSTTKTEFFNLKPSSLYHSI